MPDSEGAGATPHFLDILSRENSALVVAGDEGTVVGYYFAQEIVREESWIRPARRAFSLEHITVAPACRQRGVGSALIQHMSEEARKRGIDHVELVCWTFNEDAERFFRRHGFFNLHSRMERSV